MEIKACIKKMKDINAVFIDFVDSIDDSDIKFQIYFKMSNEMFQNLFIKKCEQYFKRKG